MGGWLLLWQDQVYDWGLLRFKVEIERWRDLGRDGSGTAHVGTIWKSMGDDSKPMDVLQSTLEGVLMDKSEMDGACLLARGLFCGEMTDWKTLCWNCRIQVASICRSRGMNAMPSTQDVLSYVHDDYSALCLAVNAHRCSTVTYRLLRLW